MSDTEIISQVVAKIPRLTRNTEEWQIGTDQSGKNAAIPTTHSQSKYRKPLSDVPTFVLPARIVSWIAAKGLADRTFGLVLILEIDTVSCAQTTTFRNHKKIYRLPWYWEFFTGKYIKILIKGADWATIKSTLRKEYRNNDLDHLVNSREFLEALKKKNPRSEDDDVLRCCRLYASIFRGLILRKRLDLYTQCQCFLQGLPGIARDNIDGNILLP